MHATTTEEHLIEAQRLASVGLLAGGIAHDFNNVLTVVLTSAMLLRERLSDRPDALEELHEIEVAARWGAALTRQLLSYGRRKPARHVIMDVNELALRTERLLRRLIGEHIELATALASAPVLIQADPAQVEQVLVNLGLNARDAMPSGGRLRLETAARPGWIDVTISDTGHGMAPEILARLAEPLFTTKDEGRGTGLGLAISYMIVRQNGGQVQVSSTPGQGTVFRLSFPRVECDQPEEQPPQAVVWRGGSETILLAEDEAAVRAVAARTLRSLGYTVLEAAHGLEALEVARGHLGPVHLLVSDLVMPHLDGRALLTELRRERPEVRVLFTSGYPSEVLSGTMRTEAAVLSKPYDLVGIARRVRELLDQERGASHRLAGLSARSAPLHSGA